MLRDELIFNHELGHKVCMPRVQQVFAALFEAISELDVHIVGDSCAVAEPGMATVKPIYVNRIGQTREPQMPIAQRRQQLRVIRQTKRATIKAIVIVRVFCSTIN